MEATKVQVDELTSKLSCMEVKMRNVSNCPIAHYHLINMSCHSFDD